MNSRLETLMPSPLCAIGFHAPTWLAYNCNAKLVPQWWRRTYTCKRCRRRCLNLAVWQWTEHDWYFQLNYIWPKRIGSRISTYLRLR